MVLAIYVVVMTLMNRCAHINQLGVRTGNLRMLEMKAHTFQNLSDTSSIFKPSSLNTTRSCPGLVFPTFFRPFSFLLGSGLEILQLPAMVAGERLAGMLGCQGGT